MDSTELAAVSVERTYRMSSVRMCDRCGVIFSENAEDWSTGSITRSRKDDKGRRVSETVQQDACPSCTNGFGNPAPTLPAITTAKQAKRDARTIDPDAVEIQERNYTGTVNPEPRSADAESRR